MAGRTFTNALTGRSLSVPKGSRLERLVEADKNWTEDKAPAAKKATPKKASSSKTEK